MFKIVVLVVVYLAGAVVLGKCVESYIVEPVLMAMAKEVR